MNCPFCGRPLRDGATFCKFCGAAQPAPAQPRPAAPQTAACPYCGGALRPGAKFCKNCGGTIAAPVTQPRQPMPSYAAQPYSMPQPIVQPQKTGPNWTWLRVVLLVICAGLLTYGALTIPEKLKGEKTAPGTSVSGKPSEPGKPSDPDASDAALTAQQREEFAEIDTMVEADALPTEPEPQTHDEYAWFNGDPDGWVEVTEEGGEAP